MTNSGKECIISYINLGGGNMNQRVMKLFNKLLHLNSNISLEEERATAEIEYRPLQKMGTTVGKIEWSKILKSDNV